jgi:MFS family permease
MRKQHPLIHTLIHLKGNPRVCVYTEPLWGIPFNLFAPYVSIYMYTLGLTDSQIGFTASIGMVFQIIFSLLGGVITDKLGRKRTTFIFDILAWSIPCLIWAFSRNFSHFVLAAIINSIARVTANSWNCLLVEDCDKEEIVNIYTWVYISGLGAAFFAPLSGIFIGKFELVPTVRILYIISFVIMTVKFLMLNKYSTETRQGIIRMEETKHANIPTLLKGYSKVFIQILKTPETLFTLGIMLIMSIIVVVNNTFWAIIVTERIHIPAKFIGIFPFIRSSIMLIFFFTLVPKIGALRFKKPLLIGFFLLVISEIFLIITPDSGYFLLIISIILEACSISLISPLLDSMQVVLVDTQERARIMAILYVIVAAFTSPFGWIAGILSGIDRRLQF